MTIKLAFTGAEALTRRLGRAFVLEFAYRCTCAVGLSSSPMLSYQRSLSQSSTNDTVQVMRNHKFENNIFTYTEQDVIKYALGVGASLPDEIHYLYEQHPKFSTIPSFPTIVGVNIITSQISNILPFNKELDFNKMVHSEQYIELYKPLPTNGQLLTTTKLLDVLDKRKFCQLIFEHFIYDECDNKLGKMQSVMLCLGSSHFGRRGKCEAQVPPVLPPNRLPDITCHDQTSVNQAALYRLCGDSNPLHIDPHFSSLMGFPEPILHGLCCYGFALRHVLKTYANDDISVFKAMKVQFSKPVIPGEDITTEMWCEGSRIMFRMKAKGSSKVVLNGGFVDLIM